MRILPKTQSNAEAFHERGQALASIRKFGEAKSDFDEALRINPDSPEVLLDRGLSLAALEKHEEAITDFNAALDLDSENTPIYWARARAFLALEQYEEAIKDFDSALALEPDIDYENERELAQLAQTIVVTGENIRLNPEDGNAFHERGRALADMERYEEAVADYGAALSFDPEDGDIYHDRGQALAALGRYEEAIDDYDSALDLIPENADIWADRATAKYSEERYDETIADCDAALALNADLPETLALRETVQNRLSRFTLATVNIRSNLRGGPGTNYPIVGQLTQGDTVKPVAQMEDEQWLKLARGAWLFASLANNVSLDLPVTEHIPTLLNGPTDTPKPELSADDYYNIGIAETKTERYVEAIAAYDAALLISPEDAALYGQRGVIRVLTGDYAAAITDMDEAIRLAPDFASAFAFRGMAKALQGQYTEAKSDLDETLTMVANSSFEPAPQELLLSHPDESPSLHGYRLDLYVNSLREQVEALLAE